MERVSAIDSASSCFCFRFASFESKGRHFLHRLCCSNFLSGPLDLRNKGGLDNTNA